MLFFMAAQIVVANPQTDEKPKKLNPGGIGIQRHPDIVKDSDGIHHMVWQEPVDGQYDIFYANMGEKRNKEMGIGANKNAATRLTNSPADSVWPKIAIDPASDIIYVIWTENIPSAFPDSPEEPLPTPSVFYVASDLSDPENDGVYWTAAQNLAEGGDKIAKFAVTESDFQIGIEGKESKVLEGTMDTDKDTIKDSAEVMGTLGAVTSWTKKDTDEDTLLDNLEYILGFNPIVDERYTTQAKEFMRLVWQYSDTDSDGLLYMEETAGDWEVTMAVANIQDNGQVRYTFFPKDDHSAHLTLGLQIKRFTFPQNPPPATTVNYKITATVYPGTEAEEDLVYLGSALEWDRFKISLGPFNVGGDLETNIDISVDVTINTEESTSNTRSINSDFDQFQGFDYRTMAIWSVLLAAPSPDYNLFNYKEGGDFDPDESNSADQWVEDFLISSDPNRQDLFLEVDSLEGHNPTTDVYLESVNAFSDANIILHYVLDEVDIALDTTTSPDDDDDGAETIRDSDEFRDLLHRHRNAEYDQYIHYMWAHKIWITGIGWVYGGAKSATTAADLTHCGILIADQELSEENTDHSTLAEKRIKVLIHEVGHALNCAHEKSFGTFNAIVDGAGPDDTFNSYNVMQQNALHDDRADELIRGEGNANNRNLGSSELIEMPRFSIESVDQMDLTNKLSVDTGRVIDLLDEYV
jgi:hypothetical protein